MRLSTVILLFGLVASLAAGGDQPSLRGDQAQEVLAVLGSDTVWSRSSDGAAMLRWTTVSAGKRTVRWQEHVPEFALIDAELVHVDSDSAPDLFWTIDYENIVGGRLVLARGDSAESVFVTDLDRSCTSTPELRDVTEDGRLDVVAYEAYAVAPISCRGDPVAGPCVERYDTEWVRVWVQSNDGFRERPKDGRAFYDQLAKAYAASADSLDADLQNDAVPSAFCNRELLSKIREMAREARRIAHG